jgi:hypothetical protein
MADKYLDVKVENNRGQTVEFRLPDNEQGADLLDTLKKKARRGELESVSEGKGRKKGPEYVDAGEPPRRRGRPVEGLADAAAPVETGGNTTVTEDEAAELTGPAASKDAPRKDK